MRWLCAVLVMAAVVSSCARERGEALPFGASNATCASCHSQADDFERSAHASAATSPVFVALLPHVEEAWGTAARDRCVGCHAPSHVPSIEVPEPEGIACVSCHAAVGNRGSFDGRLVLDLGAPLDGPFADPEETPAHTAERRGFVSDAEACLTCHDLRGPELFVEPTGMEHAEAVARLDAPSCATCHMPAMEAGPIAEGASLDRPRRSHRVIGPTPPRDGDLAGYTADLRSLFAGRVTLEVLDEGDALNVRVSNVGMGHALPTGVTFLRELRVELTVRDAHGERTEVVMVLGDRSMRGEEEVALPTDADRVERRRVDPGESSEARVVVDGVMHAEARLVFAAYRPALMAELGLPDAPEVIVLATVLERP